jgi:hypothetical protein
MFFRRRNIYATLCLFWTPRRALLIPTKEHLQIVGVIGEYAQAYQPQKTATEYLIEQSVELNIAGACRLRRRAELKVTSTQAKQMHVPPIPAVVNSGWQGEHFSSCQC